MIRADEFSPRSLASRPRLYPAQLLRLVAVGRSSPSLPIGIAIRFATASGPEPGSQASYQRTRSRCISPGIQTAADVRPEARFAAGVAIQIAYNEAYRARQRTGLRHIYEDHVLDNYLDVIESAVTPDYHALLAQSEHILRQAFDQLSEKQRLTMELFFFEGYTLREISERLGDSLGNVRHHYYRALKSLKETISRENPRIASHYV